MKRADFCSKRSVFGIESDVVKSSTDLERLLALVAVRLSDLGCPIVQRDHDLSRVT
jgi:hypothetical protein